MSESEVSAALNILRRTGPEDVLKTLVGLARLNPDLGDHIHDFIDVPLQVIFDGEAKKFFLGGSYNRDGDSFRSPWSNIYYPVLENPAEAHYPSDYVRKIEVEFNEAFEAYRHTYYEGGVASVYVWEAQGGVVAVFAVRKEADTTVREEGNLWETVHVVEITTASNQVVYKLTSTITTSFKHTGGISGDIQAGCCLTRQAEHHRKLSEAPQDQTSNPHLPYVGKMIEDMEGLLERNVEQLYVPKTRQLVAGARSCTEAKPAAGFDADPEEEETPTA